MEDENKEYLTRTKSLDIETAEIFMEHEKYLSKRKILSNTGLISIIGAGFSMILMIWKDQYDSNEFMLKLFFTFATIGLTSVFAMAFLDKSHKKGEKINKE